MVCRGGRDLAYPASLRANKPSGANRTPTLRHAVPRAEPYFRMKSSATFTWGPRNRLRWS